MENSRDAIEEYRFKLSCWEIGWRGHEIKEDRNVLFEEGFTYRNFLMDVLAIFVFVVWF